VDHWNNEKERLVLITENTLLIFKYDFVMLNCEQIQKIPLNFIDRICHGTFCFPPRSLLKREGEGVRVFWDKLREPSFTSRWNPFSVDYPFTTFTYHPVKSANEELGRLCDIQNFMEQLNVAAQKAHSKNPVPGKANGVLVLNQPILIEAYVGVMLHNSSVCVATRSQTRSFANMVNAFPTKVGTCLAIQDQALLSPRAMASPPLLIKDLQIFRTRSTKLVREKEMEAIGLGAMHAFIQCNAIQCNALWQACHRKPSKQLDGPLQNLCAGKISDQNIVIETSVNENHNISFLSFFCWLCFACLLARSRYYRFSAAVSPTTPCNSCKICPP
ncbi:hypothetical protein QQF64_028720, partial [Cirrhinus molitorella]